MSRTLKAGLWLLLALVAAVVSSSFFSGPIKLTSSTYSFSFSHKNQLQEITSRNLANKAGDYAIYIEELGDKPQKYGLHALDSMPAASLYKLFLMGAVLKEVEDGNLSMGTELVADIEDLIQKAGEPDYGYSSDQVEVVYTVEQALTRVGRISDNFAAIMLAEKVGWDKIQSFADHIGSSQTVIKEPISTCAYDIANFFKLLYGRKLGSENISNQIIELLLLSKINDRIPAKLPLVDGPKAIHKTGELSLLRHDAGIVILPSQKAYVIVLMSQNLQYEDDGVETLSQISKDVYDYFVAME